MDTLFVMILISFIAGTLITWIILKLLFEKNYIAKNEFQALIDHDFIDQSCKKHLADSFPQKLNFNDYLTT